MAALDDVHLGRNVRHYRRARGWTISYLVERADTSTSQITGLETSTPGSPRRASILALCRELGCTERQLRRRQIGASASSSGSDAR